MFMSPCTFVPLTGPAVFMLPRIVTGWLIVAVLLILLVELVFAAAGNIAPAKTDTSSIAASIFFTLFTSFLSLYDSRYFNLSGQRIVPRSLRAR